MAAEEEGKGVTSPRPDHGSVIKEAAHSGPGFQSAATLLRSQGVVGFDDGREGGILSPGFRSAAAMAGWDEEALLAASLVVEDTPVREFKGKKRSQTCVKSPPTTTTSRRKRRSRRQATPPIPPVTLSLDDEETTRDVIPGPEENKYEAEATGTTEEKTKENDEDPLEKAPVAAAIPCLDRLREELSCAICLDICFEPSTTPCGHSFCKKCLKCAAAKCGKRCPKCRELISGRACTVNTVLWNTIQLLFPEEIEARKKATMPSSSIRKRRSRSPERDGTNSVDGSNSRNSGSRINSTRRATRAARLMESDREIIRRMAAPTQSEDAALALRLQREEFMGAFRETHRPQRSTVYLARANLRAMASRAIQLHTRRRS